MNPNKFFCQNFFIKLWSSHSMSNAAIGSSSTPTRASSQSNSQVIPSIHTFENNQEYLYDIEWSPAHPALFACGDGHGNLDLWNINSHTEMPIASYKLKSGGSTISRLSWSPKGDLLAVGDDLGRLEILDVSEQLYNVKQDEWHKFMEVTQELMNTSNDEIKGSGDGSSRYRSSYLGIGRGDE